MTDTTAQRLSFAMIAETDKQAIRAVKPIVLSHMGVILDRFYDHLLRFPELKAMFRDERHIAHAKSAQRAHWERLFSADFDDSYLASVSDIGRAHHRIGLEPCWYIGGYGVVLGEINKALTNARRQRLFALSTNSDLGEQLAAVNRAILLDINLVFDVYFSAKEEAHRRFIQTISDDFSKSVVECLDPVRAETDTVREGAEQLNTLATDASRRTDTVGEASQGCSQTMQTIAAAVEEFSVALREVSSHLQEQTRISAKARESGRVSEAATAALTSVAGRIGEMVNLISKIAGQTNLLALNASIEAARAGEAGKGFAVVAGEVKSLAAQTEKATGDISRLVDEVGKVVTDVQSATGTMVEVISSIDESTEAIAAAVEEQTVAIQSISENVQQSARSIQAVSSNICEVQSAVTFTHEWADRLQGSISGMSGRICQLHKDVGGFLGKLGVHQDSAKAKPAKRSVAG